MRWLSIRTATFTVGVQRQPDLGSKPVDTPRGRRTLDVPQDERPVRIPCQQQLPRQVHVERTACHVPPPSEHERLGLALVSAVFAGLSGGDEDTPAGETDGDEAGVKGEGL